MMDQNNSIVQLLLTSECDNCKSATSTLWCPMCGKDYCQICSTDIHKFPAFSDHCPVPIDKKPKDIVLCAQCSKKELEFRCNDCDTVVCAGCLLSSHKDHKFVFINTEIKDQVIQALSHVQNTEAFFHQNLKEEFEQIDTIEQMNGKKIEKAFSVLHKMLHDHERLLKEQIRIIETKNRNLIEGHQRRLFSHEQQRLQDQKKVFATIISTKDHGKHIKGAEESLPNSTRAIEEFHSLQPPVRIAYRVEGLDQLEKMGDMLQHVHIIEQELRPSDAWTDRNLKLERFLADNEDRKSLILRAQKLNNQDMIIVAHLLRRTTMLNNLNLSSNQIRANGVHSLTTALLVNTTLTKLNLSENFVSDQGVQHLADMLGENKTLVELYFDHNQIGVSGAQHLAAVLKTNKTLAVLQLADNTIGDAGIEYLANALKTNQTLKLLNVSGNHIGPTGAKHLARTLRKNKTLTTLSLSGNFIGDEGVIHLGNAFKRETILTALHIASNGITDNGAQYLIDSLQENVTLGTLDYAFNRISDELSRHMQQVITIIASCKERSNGIEEFRLFRKKKKPAPQTENNVEDVRY